MLTVYHNVTFWCVMTHVISKKSQNVDFTMFSAASISLHIWQWGLWRLLISQPNFLQLHPLKQTPWQLLKQLSTSTWLHKQHKFHKPYADPNIKPRLQNQEVLLLIMCWSRMPLKKWMLKWGTIGGHLFCIVFGYHWFACIFMQHFLCDCFLSLTDQLHVNHFKEYLPIDEWAAKIYKR